MGDTPLIGAARRGRAADVVALLADGADVNEPNTGSGDTALWVASGLGHAEVVTTLLAANADVNKAQKQWHHSAAHCQLRWAHRNREEATRCER